MTWWLKPDGWYDGKLARSVVRATPSASVVTVTRPPPSLARTRSAMPGTAVPSKKVARIVIARGSPAR